MSSIPLEYWQRLESLFHAALQLNARARRQFLDIACVEEPELRRQVESLIVSSQDSASLLEEVISKQAASITELQAGERIGQYEILRKLGEGGMGTVYLAARADDEFRKHVAIKLMLEDLISRTAVQRFRQERQILAALEHPGIARLLDGGTTPLGSPYVVMDYVDGTPVDVFCEERKLSVRERLSIFLKIADAIEYAHRNLIIHRDIKAENVLVTAQGEPKLLDFGIAKLLKNEELLTVGQTALKTIAAERLMTPEYASPEQARGEAITTQSDVYSLGVLLYKILTQQLPFRITGSGAAEIERAICETVPTRPSVAAARSGAWSKLRRDEQKDLDTILKVALHKEPARRYASVENFAADVRRFLDGFPLQARDDSWTYRSTKMVHRHPLASTAGVLFLLVILGFSVSMAVFAKRAREEARTANEVTDFVVSVFQSNDPSMGRADKVTARELLDRGAEQLNTHLQGDPLVQARLFDTLGGLYNALGSPQKAEELLNRSIDIRRKRLTLDDEAAANTFENLGDLAADMSRYVDAEQSYRRAMAIHVRNDGPESSIVAQDKSQIGAMLWNQGHIFEAEKLDREAIAQQVKAAGEDDLTTLGMENDLGAVLITEGRYAEAAQTQKSVLDKRTRVEAPNHPDLGYSWHNYGQALAYLGRLNQAEAAERQSLAIRIQAYGENHPQVAMTEGELAKVLVKVGKVDEALRLALHGFSLESKIYGLENRDTTYTEANLSRALLATGDSLQALQKAQEAVNMRRKLLGAAHPKLADGLELLGATKLALNDLAGATQDLNEAISIRKAFYGPRHVSVADGEILLAETLARAGHLTDARKIASDALDLERAALPTGHPQIGLAKSALAQVELADKNAKAALALLEDAYTQVAAAYGAGNPQTASVGMRLARAFAANSDTLKAQQTAAANAPSLLNSKDPRWLPERILAKNLHEKGVSALR